MRDSVSSELIAALARYGSLPMDEARAQVLSEILGPAVAKLRSLRPLGYETLAPDLNFHVPVPPDDADR